MRSLPVLALIACSLSLSACGTIAERGLETVHQPVVSRTDYVFDIPAPGSDRFAPRDADRLDGWFQSIKLRFGDRVSVDAPDGDSATRQAVADVTARYGLLLGDAAPVTEGEIPGGSVRVVVSRMTASVPNCPDFGNGFNAQFGGSQTSNYGCAASANLAAMVADPHDLLSGREGAETVDAATSTKAIKGYRTNPLTGTGDLKTESTKSGGK